MLAPALLLAAALAAGGSSKPVLTVLYFDNNTGEAGLEVLRKGLADMVITDLVAWDGVTVVEREKLEAVIGELKLQRTKSFDAATAVKVGRFLGAQYLLTGAIGAAGGELRVDAKLVEAAGARVVASASVRGPREKVFDLEQELVERITAGIDLKVKNQAARRRAKVPDLEALLAYSRAIDLSDQGKVEEAQKAMQQLVSRSPSFLMAREKKEQILEKLRELEKRRADLVTGSALELAGLADAALADAARFADLDEPSQRRLLSMRSIKGLFLARVLKQHLSWRRERFRVVLPEKQAQAVATMRAWLENQRRLLEELAVYERLHRDSSPRPELAPEVAALMRDARMGEPRLSDALEALVRFVVEGRCRDGEGSYRVGPALGDLDPQEQRAAFELVGARIDAALAEAAKAEPARREPAEHAAARLVELKAEALVDLGRDEEAIAEYQRFLDAFPAGRGGERFERAIKRLIGVQHEDTRSRRERWAQAMKEGCADDMDLRVAAGTVLSDRMRRLGLQWIPALAKELAAACKPTPRSRGGFAHVYRDLALEAAHHEDCEGFRTWFTQYVEMGGSVADMLGYQKNHTPWCELGDVTRRVVWLTAALDGAWTLELDRHLVSVLSGDGKVLTLMGSREQDSFSLRLEAAGPDRFTCTEATWQRGDERLEGDCAVTLRTLAREKGEHDEGTFRAGFARKDRPGKTELREGRFRLRRE